MWLRIACGERHPAGKLAVEADLEGILSGARQRNVEHQHRPSLDVDHPGRGLTELDRAFTTQELGVGLIDETDADGVAADLGSPAPNPKHQMSTRINRREVGEPDVLKHAEHAELALLIDEGVVGDDREIEVQGSGDSDGRDDVVLVDLVYHIHPFGDLAEDRVHPVEVRLW